MPSTTPRRRFLAACGSATAAALAGCSGFGDADGPRIVSKSFERLDSADAEAVEVAFDAEENAVRVTGFAYYGSDSCDKLALQSASYDPDTDTLAVRVGSERKLFSLACTGVMSGTDYRVTVRFAGGLPGTVEVEEYLDGERDDGRTVELDAD